MAETVPSESETIQYEVLGIKSTKMIKINHLSAFIEFMSCHVFRIIFVDVLMIFNKSFKYWLRSVRS